MSKSLSLIIFPLFVILLLFGCQSEPTHLPKGFEIHPDFNLELVAMEPLVKDPVDMEFDESGKTYVLEMAGYPLRDEESRVVILKDKDGDGVYDERVVYAEGLSEASSIMAYDGGLLVAAPPELIFVKDTDGDGEADHREVLMKGFSDGNLQHNINGLTYGLDNWIYAANGGNGGAPYFVGKEDHKVNLRRGDIRFRIPEKELVRAGRSSGGFELAFDNWGHYFQTHNTQHVYQLVFEDRYIEDVPTSPSHALTNISNHEENGLSRIFPIGEQETRVNHPEQSGYFSGACGITFYGGGAFPGAYKNSLFVADVVLNLVHVDVLLEEGAAFTAKRARDRVDFIASTDRSFRPVNLQTGPDGALYLLDMHREVIEHPEWIPDELEINMDLKAGREQGRIYKITSKNKNNRKDNSIVTLDKNDTGQLLQAFFSDNQWMRMTAQRLLVTTGNQSVVSELRQLYENSSEELVRLHSLWTLEGLNTLDNELLLNALGDSSVGIRENALKIMEQRLEESPQLIAAVLKSTEDKHPRVTMQAVLTLSTINDNWYANHQAGINSKMIELLTEPNLDQWTLLAITSCLRRQAIAFFNKVFTDSDVAFGESHQKVALSLAKLIGKQGDVAGINAILNLLHEKANTKTQTEIIAALADGWETVLHRKLNTSQRNSLNQSLSKLEEGRKFSVTRAGGDLRQALQLPASRHMRQLINYASKTVLDKTRSTEERLEMLQLISLQPFGKKEDLLFTLLDNREPIVIQKEVLRQLNAENDKGIAQRLLEQWATLGPEARRQAGNILLYKEGNHDLLLSALEDERINIGELQLDLERRRVLLFSDDAAVKRRAEALFSDARVVQRKEAIEQMRPALAMAGNIENGLAVFTTQCGQCHQYGSHGKEVGPVLTEINRKSKEALLYDILDPNAGVDTRYVNHQVQTKDGSIHLGIIQNETDEEIILKGIGGIEKQISKQNIEKLNSLGTSMMPEGLEAQLSQQDMADLLAFLQQESG